MLINLSNHPVAGVVDPATGNRLNQWSEEQMRTAESEFDMVQDLMFPDIPAEASYDEVEMLTDDYLEKCIELLSEHQSSRNGVFLSGEQVFCAVLAGKLLRRGIRAVCATSQRVNVDVGDGKSIKEFRFVRFRDYGRPDILKG